MINRKVSAFSLIELMVVIAIVAVLAAIAVPAYQTYMIKSKVGTTFLMAGSVAARIQEYYDREGSLPTVMSQIGFSSNNNYFPEILLTNLPASLNDYAAQPYIMGFGFGGANAAPGQCASFQLATYISNYNTTGAATSSNPGNYFYYLNDYILTASGSWESVCQVINTTITTGVQSDLLNGCYNGASLAGGTAAGAEIVALRSSCL